MQTILKDGKISKDEKAFLKTLENSLGLSELELINLRSKVLPTIPKRLDQSGRWPLVLQNIAWAGGLYGWGIPHVLNIENFQTTIGMEMMSFAGGFYLTHKYTKNMEIGHARAQMMRAGSVIGFHIGSSVSELLGLWDIEKTNDYGYEEQNTRAALSVLMLSVPAGIYAGDYLYKKLQPTHGQSWALSLWSSIGLYTLNQAHQLFDKRPDHNDYCSENNEYYYCNLTEQQYIELEKDEDAWEKRHAVTTLLAYPMGIWAGQHFYGDKQYSFGDALMLSQGALLGMTYGFMLTDLVQMDMEGNAPRVISTAGIIGGTVLMDKYIQNVDYSFGNSFLMALGTGTGILFNMGIAAILEVNRAEAMEVLVMTGGAAGFYFTSTIIDPEKENDITQSNHQPQFSIMPTLISDPGKNLSQSQDLVPGLRFDVRF